MSTDEAMRQAVMANWNDEDSEPEWDSQDSSRHHDRVERAAEALEYMLAGNRDDAEASVCCLEDADLEAVRKALDDLEAVAGNELGRRHS